MQLTPATTADQFEQMEALYMEAFPANERKPFATMRRLTEGGTVQMLVLRTETEPFVGLAILAIHGQTVMVDYLAITPAFRGRSFGSAALQQLLKHFAGHHLCLEIESTRIEAPDSAMRQRRKGFYLKNGFRVLPFEAVAYGVRFEILASDETVTAREYVAVYRHVYGEQVARNVKILAPEK